LVAVTPTDPPANPPAKPGQCATGCRPGRRSGASRESKCGEFRVNLYSFPFKSSSRPGGNRIHSPRSFWSYSELLPGTAAVGFVFLDSTKIQRFHGSRLATGQVKAILRVTASKRFYPVCSRSGLLVVPFPPPGSLRTHNGWIETVAAMAPRAAGKRDSVQRSGNRRPRALVCQPRREVRLLEIGPEHIDQFLGGCDVF
jgi:hypothetical protein